MDKAREARVDEPERTEGPMAFRLVLQAPESLWQNHIIGFLSRSDTRVHADAATQSPTSDGAVAPRGSWAVRLVLETAEENATCLTCDESR